MDSWSAVAESMDRGSRKRKPRDPAQKAARQPRSPEQKASRKPTEFEKVRRRETEEKERAWEAMMTIRIPLMMAVIRAENEAKQLDEVDDEETDSW